MGSISVGPILDDEELQDELEALQQQELEDKMLETGTVPVDSIQQRLPKVANGESKRPPPPFSLTSKHTHPPEPGLC